MFDYDSSPYSDKFNKEFNKKAVAPIKKDISEGKPVGATHKPFFNPKSNPADREIDRRIEQTHRELNPQPKTVSYDPERNNPEHIEAMRLFGFEEPKIDRQKIEDDINKQYGGRTFGMNKREPFKDIYPVVLKNGKLNINGNTKDTKLNPKNEIDYDYNLSFEDNLKKLRDKFNENFPGPDYSLSGTLKLEDVQKNLKKEDFLSDDFIDALGEAIARWSGENLEPETLEDIIEDFASDGYLKEFAEDVLPEHFDMEDSIYKDEWEQKERQKFYRDVADKIAEQKYYRDESAEIDAKDWR